MKRKVLVGIALGAALLVIMGGMILDTNWTDEEEMQSIPFAPSDDVNFEDTLNFAIFETYGPLILVVTLMLFGAIIGAACISKEEEDNDSN